MDFPEHMQDSKEILSDFLIFVNNAYVLSTYVYQRYAMD
jgi:hypothetical protein